jgi:hypothetical protein
MTDDETPEAGAGDGPITPDPAGEGPITPEVVRRRGASARKRRLGGDVGAAADGPAPDDGPPPRPTRTGRPADGRTFRRGCTVLTAVGVLVLVNGVTLVAGPASVRCDSARRAVESALDDDEDFNDVALPEGTDTDEIDDLDCDQAIDLAGQIPDDEDEEPSGDFVAESTIRNFGLVYSGVGIVLGALGFLLLRRQTRTLRTAALAVTVVSTLLVAPALTLGGLPIGLLMVVFVIYALGFSADAKALFPPDRNRPSLFRPRPPRGA